MFLEENDLIKLANMYEPSVRDFIKMLSEFFNQKGINNYEINNSDKLGYQLSVRKESYEELKKLIFEFAYIACNDDTTSKYYGHIYYPVAHAILPDAIKVSSTLMEKGEIHVIYPSDHVGYNIQASHHCADYDDLNKKLELIKRK